MNGVYAHLIVGFGILKFFVLTKIHQQTLCLRQLMLKLKAQGGCKEYGALNMKKKIDPEGL